MTELRPFLVRLKPDVRTMLEKASAERKKSIAQVINEELADSLSKHADLDSRLTKLIG
jgi:predicted HicB family RNase H-like nuclease